MIKWFLGIAIILVTLFVCSIFIIPKQISSQQNLFVPANPKALERNLSNEVTWKKWWPGQIIGTSSKPGYVYKSNFYKIVEKQPGALSISVGNKNSTDSAILFLIPTGPDSILLNCVVKTTPANNPVKRILSYYNHKSLNADIQSILSALKTYYSNPDHLYYINIQHSSVVDSTLLFTSTFSKSYPTYSMIYQTIDHLNKYATLHSAHITGYPMLNVSTTDSIEFITKVALPVDKKLNSSGNISYKWMLGGGNILISEIKGGPATIKTAFMELENYVKDHNLETPAIPFQSLVTNRLNEQDTNTWVTRVYYPIR